MYTRYKDSAGMQTRPPADDDSAGQSLRDTPDDPQPDIDARLSVARYTGRTPRELPFFLRGEPLWNDHLAIDETRQSAVFELSLTNRSEQTRQALLTGVLGGRALYGFYSDTGKPIDIRAPVTLLSGQTLRLYGFAFSLDKAGRYQNTVVVYPVRNGRRGEPAGLAAAVVWVKAYARGMGQL